ncbi:MAG: prenyltransferase/squalene oxidase repeat-containing protein [Gemmataceae bacterium]
MRALTALVLLLVMVPLLPAAEPERAAFRQAVAKALPLLQKSMAVSIEKRECFMCHHQALPALGVVTARRHGFTIDDKGLAAQFEHANKFATKNIELYRQGKGTGGQVSTAGYLLWTLELGETQPGAVTEAVVEYLLVKDKQLDHYRMSARRPPSEASPFTNDYLALRGLQRFGSKEQQERIQQRIEQVKGWLLKTPATDTEERVFRLWALRIAGADDKAIEQARDELLKTQRDDGGFSQTDKLESDAYATGSALVALHEAGGLDTGSPAYQRGLQFLVKSQQDDGSWYVKSRSRPFQTYFESGFPHEKDQFISITASGWAVAALALAEPVKQR